MLYVNFAVSHYPNTDEGAQLMSDSSYLTSHVFWLAVKAHPFLSAAEDRIAVIRRGAVWQNKANRAQQARVSGTRKLFDFQQVCLSHLILIITKCMSLTLRAVLKTNFYQPTKVALSFRLRPDFLPEVEYPNKPFGMFLVIGTHLAAQLNRWLLIVDTSQEPIFVGFISASGTLLGAVFELFVPGIKSTSYRTLWPYVFLKMSS